MTLTVKDTRNSSTLVSKTGTFSSKRSQYKSDNYYGFEILFDSAVNVKKNTRYVIEGLISGEKSLKGGRGLSAVHSSGVKFHFFTSCIHGNLTDQSKGQFPEFLFSC